MKALAFLPLEEGSRKRADQVYSGVGERVKRKELGRGKDWGAHTARVGGDRAGRSGVV